MLEEAFMRTTLAIKEELLNEVKTLSGAKTKKDAVEKALQEFIRRRKAKKLLDLEGKVELSFTAKELIERRRKDVPHR
jgi:Arc/MetJ family transcription regulator